jgi:toxin FitB
VSGYLLDTVILSELRKKNRSPAVAAWFQTIEPSKLYLSVVTVGEVERGIVSQERLNPAFADELRVWLDGVVSEYADRILPVTPRIARRWGRLAGETGHAGVDLLIAATALEHGLKVATRNVSHFKPSGVALVNPFECVSPDRPGEAGR